MPTREEVPHHLYEQAASRMRRLESETESACAELHRARQAMLEQGHETNMRLSKPVEAAWLAWKSGHTAEETMTPTSLRVT